MTVMRGPAVSFRWFGCCLLGLMGAFFSVEKTVEAAQIRTDPLSDAVAEDDGLDPLGAEFCW